MDSELQKALKWDEDIREALYDLPYSDDLTKAFNTTLDAARLVANPDYQAAYKAFDSGLSVPSIVDAALGTTEDTEPA